MGRLKHKWRNTKYSKSKRKWWVLVGGFDCSHWLLL